MLSLKNINLTFDRELIKNGELYVPNEQLTVLFGPSGSGKSSLLYDMAFLTKQVQMDYIFDGIDVHTLSQDEIKDIQKNQIAFVFQNTQLFKTSILNNVKIANPQASDEDVIKALQAARCQDIIEKLPDGVHTQIGKEGTYLSGGEQQRIALARAILKNAPIVVLDEATAFADPENEVLIQKALSVLCQDKTVIMIAHRLSTVVNADKIIALKDGKIIEEGRHKELLNKEGLYHKMWNNQSVKWKITSGKEGI